MIPFHSASALRSASFRNMRRCICQKIWTAHGHFVSGKGTHQVIHAHSTASPCYGLSFLLSFRASELTQATAMCTRTNFADLESMTLTSTRSDDDHRVGSAMCFSTSYAYIMVLFAIFTSQVKGLDKCSGRWAPSSRRTTKTNSICLCWLNIRKQKLLKSTVQPSNRSSITTPTTCRRYSTSQP